jgi:DNA-binding transcriptional MerR regulator
VPELPVDIEIPRRALFKAIEVCDILKVQPYVLRSWEAEFPELGVTKVAGGPRVYRREDVEQVARIKHLLLVEGLTLAGARRRLEEEMAPVAANAPALDELIGRNARERLTVVKHGLRSILDLLSSSGATARVLPHTSAAASASRVRTTTRSARQAKPVRGKAAARQVTRAARPRRSR